MGIALSRQAVAGDALAPSGRAPAAARPATGEPPWARRLLIGAALLFLGLFLIVPLAAVFAQGLAEGAAAYAEALRDPDALAAIRLTLLVTAVAVPLNTVFGIVTALVLVRSDVRGKRLLEALIDLPFAVSPVVIGLALFLLYG
ncbi:MAG TPA: hypothetical protein VFS05_03410, partial [Gemmatimonadaceae bacterium]|nr:hypothetical protein [Gemmatimonadaceae bacterium]